MNGRISLPALVFPFLLLGCRTVDVAARHAGPPPVCEVHGQPMAPELMRVSFSDAVYLQDYRRIAQMRFPRHGGTLLSGERDFRNPIETRVRDFVCPDCDRAWREFWKIPSPEKFLMRYWETKPVEPPRPAAGAVTPAPAGGRGSS